jgi:hypothetical protein
MSNIINIYEITNDENISFEVIEYDNGEIIMVEKTNF